MAKLLIEVARGGKMDNLYELVIAFEDFRRIKSLLVDVVRHDPLSGEAAEAVFLLSKLHDEGLREVFQKALERQSAASNAGTFQTMIALSNMGERVFCLDGALVSHQSHDDPNNFKMALNYLASLDRS